MKTRLAASFFVILCASAVLAVDYTWTGGGLDNNWSTPANWGSTTDYPASASDNAIFPALASPITVTVDIPVTNRTIFFRNPSGTTITIPSGLNLHLSNAGGVTLRAEENAVIDGGGTVSFSTGGGTNWADNQVSPDKTLTIDAQVTGDNGFEHNGTGGIIYLNNPLNNQLGATTITAAGWLSVPSVGNVGTANPLGKGSEIQLANGDFRYTGANGSTDVSFRHTGGGSVDRTIEHAGTGTLTFTGPIRSGNDNSHAFIFNIIDPAAAINIAGTYLNGGSGALWLYKRGPGTLSVSSATTHSGNTVIQQGTVEILPGGSLGAASLLRLQGGRILLNAAGNTQVPGTVQVEGNGSIEIASGIASATLTIGTLNNSFGTVDFNAPALGGATKIFIANQSDGLIGAWATVNGGANFAAYDSVNGVHAAALTSQGVDVHGGVIRDNENSIANIKNAGTTGDITLEKATTRTAALSQEIAIPATVEFGTSTLITPTVRIQPAGAALTLNNGTLTAPNLPPSGARLSLANTSASDLTVNAALADNGATPLRIDKIGAGSVILTGAIEHTGGTAITEGTLTVSNATDLSWPGGGISGSGNLAKTGPGTLTFPNNANTYTGATHITQGTAAIYHNDTFGDKNGPTYVSGTGAIDFIGTGGNSLALSGEMIYAEGNGPGDGALRNTSANSQYNAIRLLTLTDDLGIYTASRLDVRNNGGNAFLNFNGHGITKKGGSQFGLTNVTSTNDQGKAFIDIQDGSVTFEVGTTLTGGTNNYVRAHTGTYFDFYNLANPVNWSLILDGGSRINVRNNTGTNVNVWAGPVILGGTVTLNAEGAMSDTYTGAITGTGPIVKTAGNINGTTYLLGTNNTWTGGARVESGILYAADTGSLPGYATDVTVTGRGALVLRVADTPKTQPGFTLDDIDAIIANGTFTDRTTVIGFETLYADLDYTESFPSAGVRKYGPNTLTLSGPATDMGLVTVHGGTLDIPAYNRTLDLENITVGISASPAEPLAILDLNNTGGLTTTDRGNQVQGQPGLIIGDTGRGVLRVSDEAFVNGKLIVGNAGAGAGAVHQTGGTVHNTGGHSNDGRIGFAGYGYYLLAGGSFINNGYSHLGRDLASVGILHQTGGDFTYTGTYGGSFGISRGGSGVIRADGGTFTHTGSLWIGDNNDNGSTNGYAELTVSGNADIDINNTVDTGNRDNMTAVVNLNGGTLTANRIHRHNRANPSSVYLNWNGGTLRARNADAELLSGAVAGLYPDVTLYGLGAVIDIPDAGKSKRINTPFNAPSGLGVTRIPVLDGGAGYIGSPFVRIAGGAGTGASAFAHVDLEHGTVTEIEITSPGNGYSYFTAPTVTLIGGGATTAATLGAIQLSYQTSGGLTKLGTGTLTLAATNTYTGPTEVRDGILKLNDTAVLSPLSQISLTGGILDLNGGALSNGTLNATSGSIINGYLSAPSISKDGPGTFTLATPVAKGSNAPVPPTPLMPGLWEGMIRHNWNDWSENPKERIQFTTRAANGGVQASNGTYADRLWEGGTHTWVYSGYIWNRGTEDVTWTFFGRFDDNMHLLIDGKTLMRNSNSSDLFVTYTLTPGAHPFEARFGDGSGDVGPGPKDRSVFPANGPMSGLLVDYTGQPGSTADLGRFQILQDPGDGSLFTLDIPEPFDGPGLHESVVQRNNNTGDEGSYVSRQLTTRVAIGPNESNATYCDGLWTNGNHTWIYTGYIWNHAPTNETWFFRGRFDDYHYLTINGDLIYSGGNGGTAVESAQMTPGANAIEIRFCDGGGSVGPSGLDLDLGIAYDPDGTGYRQIIDPGDGSLLSTTPDWVIPSPATPEPELVQVNVTDGTLKLSKPLLAAGLLEGLLEGNRNLSAPNPGTITELTTTAANGVPVRIPGEGDNAMLGDKYWPTNSTYVYTGYIWNHGPATQWTFAEHFDDYCQLTIDGNIVFNDTAWDRPTYSNVWMTTGSHAFEVRFGQGGGGAGPSVDANKHDWKSLTMSFGVDFQGRGMENSDYYEILQDPGDGSLLTWTLDLSSGEDELLGTAQANLGDTAVLDLNSGAHKVAMITGTGTVTNGTLAANTVISPAGDDAIGTLTFGDVTLASSGITYRVTLDAVASDRIESSTSLNLSGLTIIPAPGSEPTASLYVIGTAPEFTGTPTLSGFPKKYKVAKRGTNLILTSEGGTIMILR